MNEKDKNEVTYSISQPTKAELSLFQEKPELYSVFKRTQKIGYALYMISDLLDKSEPLRNVLRDRTNILLSLTVSLSSKEKDRYKTIHSYLAVLYEIMTLLDAGYFAGLVSEMNVRILKTVMVEVGELLNNEKPKYAPQLLATDFLEVKESEEYKRQFFIKDSSHSKTIVPYTTSARLPVNVLNTKLAVKDNPSAQATIANKSDRATAILSLLKDGKERSIKDFLVSIKGCSEKTIQRELLSLVAAGLLKKKGERRWSRYSL